MTDSEKVKQFDVHVNQFIDKSDLCKYYKGHLIDISGKLTSNPIITRECSFGIEPIYEKYKDNYAKLSIETEYCKIIELKVIVYRDTFEKAKRLNKNDNIHLIGRLREHFWYDEEERQHSKIVILAEELKKTGERK